MAAPQTFLRSAALVASTMIVGLVLVVSSLVPRSSTAPLPLEPTAPATLAASTWPVAREPAARPTPAPATSSAPLSAIPIALPPVEIVVLSTPQGATVSRAGRALGLAPGPFALENGNAKVTLEVSAVGYEPGIVEVVPSTGKTVSVRLQRARPRQAPSRDAPKSN